MEKSNKLFLLFLMTVLLFSVVVIPVGSPFVHAENKPPVEYVDPLIGTDVYFPEGAMGEANVFPGATTPHGMVQLSPDTGRHIAGYLYSDDHIEGFSFTHFSGTGSWGFGNFLSTATTGELHTTENTYKSKFSHEEETASAGYYSVRLQDYDIQAELTATTRVGLLRYTFPESDTSHILLDASHTLEDEPVSEATIQVLDNETVVGSQTNPSPFHHGPTPYTIYFAAKFSQPFDSYGTWNGNRVREGSPSASGRDVGAFFNYNTDPGEQVLVKVGISYVSTDNALANIEAEVPDWDFEQVKEQARNTWNERLSRIEVSGGSEEDKVKFYTSLYRALLGPYTFSDANGEYIGFDHKIHRAEGYTQYHTFSLWDTFRHAHPLYTLIEPEVQNDAVRSLIADYEQGGWLPRWPMANVYTNDMISDHASSVMAETIMKGITDFDVEKAYEAMVHNATETPEPDEAAWGRANLAEYVELGYIPHELNSQSVSWTVENAYVDFAIAQVAKSLGKEEDYETFMKRAKSFINVFDPETRWMRPRHEDGSWKTPFDPGDWTGLTEGNAWTYSWFVPHDVRGLAQLMGEKTFTDRLDHFFEAFVYPAYNEKISHYWHGNEPDQHVPFLYNFVGQPWKTQEVTQRILHELYGTGPNGIPGNEDMGQLSAWFVFSAMGISPVAPVTGEYQITSPIFDRVVIHMPEYHYGGKDFVIETDGDDGDIRYIASAELNGEPLNWAWIPHETVSQGGKLTLTMDAKPNKQWAADPEAAPSSMTTEKPQLAYDSFELTKQEVDANEPLNLTATITNVGGLGMAKAEIYVDGKAYDTEEVLLDAGETKQVTLSTRLYEGGVHSVSVGNLPAKTVIVNPKPAEFAYSDVRVKTSDSKDEITAEVDIQNIGSYSHSEDVQLYVDDEAVSSQNVTLAPGESQTVTFTYPLSDEHFHWVRIGSAKPQVVVPDNYTPSPEPVQSYHLRAEDGQTYGLTAKYYNNRNFEGEPVLTQVDEHVNFDWGTGSPASGVNSDQFSVRWTGTLTAPVTGTYEFFLTSDDGSRLYINDELVIDHWGDHGVETKSQFMKLEAGKHYDIRLEYYENTADAVVQLSWDVPVTGLALGEQVVEPGERTTFQIGVKSRVPQSFEMDWSASVPSGLSLSPDAGTITVDSGKANTTSVTVAAADNAAPGVYEIPIQLKSESSELQMTVNVWVAESGDLSVYFNNAGISDDDKPDGANYDLAGWSYSYQALKDAGIVPGTTIFHDGLSFKWPDVSPGERDNIVSAGQSIPLKGSGTKIGFIGSATHGPSSGKGKIYYVDGSVQEFELGFRDWTSGGGNSNEVVATLPYRNSPSGKDGLTTYVYYTSVPLDHPDKMVRSVTLPEADTIDKGRIHIFDITIKYAAPKSGADLKTRITQLAEEGAINEKTVYALNVHLTAVNQFEKKNDSEKVVKHLQSFHHLLDYHGENGRLTEAAYRVLKADTDYLIRKWQP